MEMIELLKHDDRWKDEFLSERSLLLTSLVDIFYAIHHVGSTAVPDLLAKPIIDISAESLMFPPDDATIQRLSLLGYEHRGEAGVPGRIWFTKGTPRKFNLHLCPVGSQIVKRQIAFCNKLTGSSELRREYELLKMTHMKHKGIDDPEYAFSKTALIDRSLGMTSS